MDFRLLILDDRSQSFYENRAYLIEVEVNIVEDALLEIMGEQYDGSFLDFDIPRVKEGIVEGIDE